MARTTSPFPPMLARHLPLRYFMHGVIQPLRRRWHQLQVSRSRREQTPIEMTSDAAAAAGSTWGKDAKPLTGTVTPGLYKDADNVLWWVIQSYNTATYPNPLVIPALIRVAKIPGEALPWQQPHRPVRCLQAGQSIHWRGRLLPCTRVSSGRSRRQTVAGNNVWEPGVFGWIEHRPCAADPVEPRWRPVRRCGGHPQRQPDGHRGCGLIRHRPRRRRIPDIHIPKP